MKAKILINILESLANLELQESWDNSGFLLGDTEKEVKKVMIALDLTDANLEEAIREKVDFIITHHPLLFRPMKKIVSNDFIGRRVLKCIQHDIAYYAMHTNFDAAVMGELAAKKLGLSNLSILDKTYEEDCYKLSVYVPIEYADQVRDAMTGAGAGCIGAYSHCTYNIKGEGTFQPLEGSNPFLGEVGAIETVKEIKIETVVPSSLLKNVIGEMKKVHPYEEVAYDVYKLEKSVHEAGAGKVGTLPEKMTLLNFCNLVKQEFNLDSVRLFGDESSYVEKIAVLPGSGGDYIKQALLAGADVYLTGDISHHDGIDANACGLFIVDAGHYGLEKIFIEYLAAYLTDREEITVITEKFQNPFKTV